MGLTEPAACRMRGVGGGTMRVLPEQTDGAVCARAICALALALSATRAPCQGPHRRCEDFANVPVRCGFSEVRSGRPQIGHPH